MRTFNSRLALGALALTTLIATSANAQWRPGPGPRPPQRDRIVSLGTTKLSPLVDSDIIRTNSCSTQEQERVIAFRVRAVKNAANIDSLRVTYANGNYDDIRGGITLRQGQITNWVDLEGRQRCVVSVRVLGSSASPIFQKATIEIQGLVRERSERDREDRRDEPDRGGPGRPQDPRDPRGPGRGPGRPGPRP